MRKEKICEVIIPELPPTDNHLYGQRGKIKFMYKKARDWKEKAADIMRTIYNKKVLDCFVEADIWLYLKRDRDTHGGLKVLFDAFEGVLYENDKQIIDENLHKRKTEISKIAPFIKVVFYKTDNVFDETNTRKTKKRNG